MKANHYQMLVSCVLVCSFLNSIFFCPRTATLMCVLIMAVIHGQGYPMGRRGEVDSVLAIEPGVPVSSLSSATHASSPISLQQDELLAK